MPDDEIAKVLKEFVISQRELAHLKGRLDSLNFDINANAEQVTRHDEMLRGSKGEAGVMLRLDAMERSVRTVINLSIGIFVLVMANIVVMLMQLNG